jgi:signal transduction histidine kinase
MIAQIQRRPVLAYSAAVIESVAALLIVSWLRQTGLARDLFVLSYGAVFLSAWIGGLGPGIVAILTSSLLTAWILIPPAHSLAVELDDVLRIGIFALIALLTSSLLARERRARVQAETALRQRNALMAAISHDLKNPLTTIRARAQLLRRMDSHSEQGSPERFRAGLAAIEEAATRVTDQVDELLDAARLDAGQDVVLQRTGTDLVGLVRDLVRLYRPSAHHQIRFDAEAQELVGMWDRGRLTRAIENLLANAIKYSPEGGQISIRARQEDDWAVVEIRDQGVGIPAHELPNVFDQFQRGSNAARVAGGNGVGLASARRIVEQHGGRIAVQSQEGAGSTFSVYLPRTPLDTRAF